MKYIEFYYRHPDVLFTDFTFTHTETRQRWAINLITGIDAEKMGFILGAYIIERTEENNDGETILKKRLNSTVRTLILVNAIQC